MYDFADVGTSIHGKAVADEKRVRVATDDAGLVVPVLQSPKGIAVGRAAGETDLAVVIVASSEPREQAERFSRETPSSFCAFVRSPPIAPPRHKAPRAV